MSNLDRIAALLAKAERTDNPAEAEAYLAKAQSLATQASVDLAVARARIARREARQSPMSRTITVGAKGKRANTHLVSLFIAVGHANDLQMDIARNSTYVIAYGMPGDIDAAEALFGSLATQMVSAAGVWLSVGEWRGESYVARSGSRKVTRLHTMQTARAAFYQGFVRRIGARLQEARDEVIASHAQEVVELDHESTTTGALVLREKAAEIRAFYRSSSKARGSWSGYSGSVRGHAGSATAAGREAATRARLTSPRGLPGGGRGIERTP